MPLPVLQEVQAIFIDGLPIGGYGAQQNSGITPADWEERHHPKHNSDRPLPGQAPQWISLLSFSGSIVAWGHANAGGDSSAVQDQLRGVVQIQAAGMAFAVILADGSVVTLGN